MIYGRGFKATFSTSVWFDHQDIYTLTSQYYIIAWNDDGDGNVEWTDDTFTIVAQG